MKPVTEVRQETAEVLGNAVAEVARRAIRPELDPFKKSLESLVGELEDHAKTLGDQVEAEKKALEALNKQLGEVVATGRSQAAAAADTQARVHELRERLDSLAGELAATREEQATTVAALNSLRDEVQGWMRASNEQAERLASVLVRAEQVANALDSRARAFTVFGNRIAGQVDARATEVLQGIADVRANVSREATELRNALRIGFHDQGASSRAAAGGVVARVNAAVESITSAVASAREAGSADMAAFGAARQTQQAAATADVRAHGEELNSALAAKIDSEFCRVVELLESGNQRATGDVAALRTNAMTRLTSLQTELGDGLERLSARHEGHRVELQGIGQMAERVFRLAVANLLLVLVALAVGGVALWVAAK